MEFSYSPVESALEMLWASDSLRMRSIQSEWKLLVICRVAEPTQSDEILSICSYIDLDWTTAAILESWKLKLKTYYWVDF